MTESSKEAKGDKGPSKKELKKMAKKAEKAAKKAGGGGEANNNNNNNAKKNAAKEASPKSQPPIVLELCNAKSNCTESLKVMWAAQVYGVDKFLKFAGEDTSNGNELVLKSTSGDGETNTVTSGRSIATAFSMFGATKVAFMEHTLVDEWCEWEKRVDIPNANDKKLETFLGNLSSGLGSAASKIYIVGTSTTVADICIVSSLKASIGEKTALLDKFPTIKTYLEVHTSGFESAQVALDEFCKGPPDVVVDMENTSIDQVLEQIFVATLQKVFGPDVPIPKNNWIAKSSKPKLGDFQCTAAMALFSSLKGSPQAASLNIRSPPDVAKCIVQALESSPSVAKVLNDFTIQGPGFILCRLAPSYLQHHANKILLQGHLPKLKQQPQVCVVDFSSPNIAKEMHVGHLRSTIIGESVCRILEYAGHQVHRVNHVGDWGTQFGMLIQFLKEEYPDFQENVPNITDLTLFYKSAKARFDEDADFKKTSQLNVVQLQSGNEECLGIWKILCDVSRKEFQKVYNRLDISVEECGESFYNSKIPPVIKEFEGANLISIEEGGAKCVFCGDKFQIPLMLQKSDGGYGYDSTDMAALKYRIHELGAQRIIYITDFSQGNHFAMCFAAAEKIGWKAAAGVQLQHIGFGTVMGEDGKRFKTRSGDTVRLVDLLDEAVRRMEDILRTRNEEKKQEMPQEEIVKISEAIGYSAVKYFDLRRNPTTNYKFSYDQMLDTKGNTAVYLLYAHARLESIVAKAQADFGIVTDDLVGKEPIVLGHASERALVMRLQGFTDMMLATLEDLFPYRVCDFVYNLSIAASDFVTQCKVLGSPEMKSRLLLCKLTTLAMRECFELVGIRHVQRI